jgi:hypothetical protein
MLTPSFKSPTKSKPAEFFDTEADAPPIKLALGTQNLSYGPDKIWKSDLEGDYEELLAVVEGLQKKNLDLEMENKMTKYKVSTLVNCLGLRACRHADGFKARLFRFPK